VTDDDGRLAREIAFHRGIADHAELIWNWDSPSGRARAARRAALLVEAAGLRPGVRALELGCGTGVFLEKVAVHGATITGIDLSADLLSRCAERMAAASHVTLVRGNAEKMPFPDGAFDAVYGSSILHHLNLEAALAEVRRVLRPGGRLAFAEPNILNPQVAVMFRLGITKKYFGVSPDEMAFSRFHARAAAQRAGLAGIEVTPFDFLHPATPPPLIGAVSALGRAAERLPLAREIAGSMLIAASRPPAG
jgi:ubiquinone/menaquinone biosynthesis C-methylase UbiE